jgi:aspartate/methionine/tyrosine aminotransferase
MSVSPKFSSRIASVAAENRLAALVSRLKSEGKAILNMAESNPTRCGLQAPGVLEALARPESLAYAPDPRGLPVARKALAERLSCNPDELFLASSSSEAYGWLFKLLCDPGDAVLVPKPGYPLFDYLAGLEGVRALPYALEYRHPRGWTIDIDRLLIDAERRGAKAVVLINPNNPTGSYIRADERPRIVAACASAGIAIIADEVFFPYALEDDGAQRSFGGEAGCLCFTLDGLSKLLCLPQLKLGWIRLSGPASAVAEANSRLEIIADAYLSASAPVMNALPDLLPAADSFVLSLRKRMKENLSVLRAQFEGEGSPYRVLRCEGGWTALLECPRVASDEELALGLLLDAGVLAHPGYFFDFERDGYLALSLIVPPADFARGAAAIRGYLDGLLA